MRVKNPYKLKSGDLSGKKFGKWTVVDRDLQKVGESHWNCKCSCGKEQSVKTRTLINGKSEGCRECYLKEKRVQGHGDVPGSYWKTVKSGATQRNLEFAITAKFAWDLFKKQHGKCNLSGVELSFDPLTASLDRIDSSKGYTEDNVQWVHRTINKMKNDIDQTVFLEFCSMVTKENSNGRN